MQKRNLWQQNLLPKQWEEVQYIYGMWQAKCKTKLFRNFYHFIYVQIQIYHDPGPVFSRHTTQKDKDRKRQMDLQMGKNHEKQIPYFGVAIELDGIKWDSLRISIGLDCNFRLSTRTFYT